MVFKHFLAPFGVSLLFCILLAIVLFSPDPNYLDRLYIEMDVFQSESYNGYRSAGIDLYETVAKLRRRHLAFSRLDTPDRYQYVHALMGAYMKMRIKSLVSRFWQPSGRLWQEQKQMADNLFDEVLRELSMRHGY